MAYAKPGIEVTQSRNSFSPNLVAPSLVPVIIGTGYHVEDIGASILTTPDMSTYSQVLIGDADTQTTVAYSGLDANWTVDLESVYVDIVMTSGTSSYVGNVLHCDNDSSNLATIGASSVIIQSGIASRWYGGKIQVGYRATRNDIDNLYTIETQRDITDNIGAISPWNPLALGTSIARQNAGVSAVSYYGVSGYTTENKVTPHSNARDELELSEVYAMAPLTIIAGVQNSYTTYANSMSLPENKRERINLVNPAIAWKTDADEDAGAYTSVDSNKVNTASQTRATAYAARESRAIYTFPDILYARVNSAHISKLSPLYIQNTIWGTINPNLKAILAQDYNIQDNTVALTGVDEQYINRAVATKQITWPKGTEISEAIFDIAKTSVLKDDTYVNAYVPVPGYYVCAALAGKIADLPPQQGLTNLSLNVLDGLKYSNDFFTETQLNTIADGGNFIVTQDVKNTPPYYVRHQLTTNRDSVETQELSIIKTIDYVAKFIRSALGRQIGRFNITPRYLKQLRMILGALADNLIKRGIVENLAITTLAQHATQKDRVVITLSTQVFYPANYIDVTIVY